MRKGVGGMRQGDIGITNLFDVAARVSNIVE